MCNAYNEENKPKEDLKMKFEIWKVMAYWLILADFFFGGMI